MKKGRENTFKCSLCGKYVSYKEIEDNKVLVVYTPDTEYTMEETRMTHTACHENLMKRIKNKIWKQH